MIISPVLYLQHLLIFKCLANPGQTTRIVLHTDSDNEATQCRHKCCIIVHELCLMGSSKHTDVAHFPNKYTGLINENLLLNVRIS